MDHALLCGLAFFMWISRTVSNSAFIWMFMWYDVFYHVELDNLYLSNSFKLRIFIQCFCLMKTSLSDEQCLHCFLEE